MYLWLLALAPTVVLLTLQPTANAQQIVGPGQVATPVIPPPGKNAAVFGREYQYCTQTAHGQAPIFVRCMLQYRNIVRVIGPGGVEWDATKFAAQAQSVAPAGTPQPAAGTQQSTFLASNIGRMMAADQAHNYPDAMQWALKVIQEGSGWARTQEAELDDRALAEFNIAVYYDEGLGTAQDFSKSAYWYEKSINDNDASNRYPGASGTTIGFGAARTRLGMFYAFGLGVPQDRARARALFAAIGRGGDHALTIPGGVSALIELLDTNRLPRGGLNDVRAAITKLRAEKARIRAQEEARAAAHAEAEARRQAAIEARNPPPRSRSGERPSSWEPSHPSALGCHIAGNMGGIAGCPPWGW